tara:strand:- start:10 stop:366 length:357 start_codon:yes stop_codon:yes gene_type:complete
MVSDQGLKESFARVKSDIMSLQANILELSGKQGETLEMLSALLNKERKLEKKVDKKVKVVKAPVKRKKSYVASKTGKSFHVPECPFAKNIQPKSEVKFKSTDAALNKGYKACECVKRI